MLLCVPFLRFQQAVVKWKRLVFVNMNHLSLSHKTHQAPVLFRLSFVAKTYFLELSFKLALKFSQAYARPQIYVHSNYTKLNFFLPSPVKTAVKSFDS